MKSDLKPNWPLLALVRFVLASLIALAHFKSVDPESPALFLTPLNGFSIVCGFLLISGFSISHSIHREQQGFYVRRFERIYPTYFACLLLAVVPFVALGAFAEMPGGGSEAPTLAQFVSSAFMLQNVAALPFGTFTPSWSLAVECFFYLLTPLFFRLGNKAIWGIVALSALFFVIEPLGFLPGRGVYYADQLFMTPALFLLCFWLLGWLWQSNSQSELVKTCLLLLPVLIAINPKSPEKLGVVSIAFVSLCLIYQNRLILPARFRGFAVYLGDLSYPLYLCHVPVAYLVFGLFKTQSFFVHMSVALLMSAAIFHLIDKPYRAYCTRRRHAQKTTGDDFLRQPHVGVAVEGRDLSRT